MSKIVSAAEVRAYIVANPDKFSDRDVEVANRPKVRGKISDSAAKAYAKAHKGKKRYDKDAPKPGSVIRLTGPRGKVREVTFAEARALIGAEGKRGRLSADDMAILNEVAFSA